MDALDYRMEAALYFSKSANKQKSLTFRRFGQAADAIAYAVEELPPNFLNGCSLEVNGLHYLGREIRPLYDSDDFPLKRRSRANG